MNLTETVSVVEGLRTIIKSGGIHVVELKLERLISCVANRENW
jgi:hypothetical protein